MKIGIDIGGSHIAIGVIEEKGKIIEKAEKRLMHSEKQNLEYTIETYIIEYALQWSQNYPVTKIGISMPGWAENGVILSSGNLGIKNYPLVEKLQEKIKLPIMIRNDAKCAALAENAYGCLKGSKRSLFLTLGTGIGGACFIENQLLEGSRRPGYEFGHMVIEKNGIPCHCGRKGCFERYASMKVFKDHVRSALNLDKTTGGKELLEILRNNNTNDPKDETIETVIEEYIENLSIGMINLINIFEPEKIGIGGSFVYFEEILLSRLRESIQKENKKRAGRGNIPIETAVFGNEAGMIGSVLPKNK